MKNSITILPKFPKEIISTVKDFWTEDQHHVKTDSDKFFFDHVDETQDSIIINPVHKLYDIFDDVLPINYKSMLYLRSFPYVGVTPVHSDWNRKASLMIAIEVDFNDSHFFIGGEEECTKRPHEDWEDVYEGSQRFKYEPEKYHFYNYLNPCVFNAKKAHGFANYAMTQRVVLSVSFDEEYDYVSEALHKEWGNE